ncbi:hypothetical protein K504DRAFT_390290 [Pleomassaria siparia CBS 279.74]|uniref:Uncharacterized protein n=1 Tax=Pleomassaria siparia CBS 279.74 TaxID=1314801 RepID=A0A6G1JV61_9PLEO|nr:hypothetical protein K504DRAFT_390290 [Pleomassaria siparia CBS 279.74]
MPQLLPAHLRTGIDYESIDTAPIDLLEDLPEDCYSEEERATKRLRIETIATSYLHGTRPMISTAGLRGPFDKWHNPWGRREEEDDNTCRDKNQKRMSGRALGRRNVNSRSVAQGRSTATRVPHRRDDGARKTRDKEEPSKTIQDFSAPVQKSPEDVPTTRTRLSRRSTRKPGKEPINHDLIASPGPASSTGFIYRKTAKTRDKERSKPRLVSFNSSPGPAKENHVLGQPRLDPHLPEGDGEGHSLKTVTEKVQSSRPDVYDIMANDMATNDIGTVVVEGHGGEGAQGSRRVSRLSSNYSTQAALLLAQMEFQEGTKSPVSYDTPRAAWFPQDDTPRPNRRQSSPLITPFHAFNEELSKRLPPESVLRGPPMSTQDLFAAASPFAFSAVKKTTIRKPAMSSLRVSVLSKDGDEHADVDVTRSPTTSAERIPLKDRNHKMSFMVTPVSGSDKGSQDSLLHSSRPWRRDVELPQLDLGTLLDDVGPNGDLEFTDRFLRNLGAIS